MTIEELLSFDKMPTMLPVYEKRKPKLEEACQFADRK